MESSAPSRFYVILNLCYTCHSFRSVSGSFSMAFASLAHLTPVTLCSFLPDVLPIKCSYVCFWIPVSLLHWNITLSLEQASIMSSGCCDPWQVFKRCHCQGLGKIGLPWFQRSTRAAYSHRNGPLPANCTGSDLQTLLFFSSFGLRASCECVREDNNSRKQRCRCSGCSSASPSYCYCTAYSV